MDPDSKYGTRFDRFQITVLNLLRNKFNTVSNIKIYKHKINFSFQIKINTVIYGTNSAVPTV